MITKIILGSTIKVTDIEARIIMDAGYALIHKQLESSIMVYRVTYKVNNTYRIKMFKTTYEDVVRHLHLVMNHNVQVQDIELTRADFFDSALQNPSKESVELFYPRGCIQSSGLVNQTGLKKDFS